MKWLILLLVMMGCTQVTSLNMKKHQFGVQPTKIIWFQVAGLEEEHIALIRFQEAGERTTSLEENTCMGKTWNYNLYQTKASAPSTFLSQITGKKNIKMTCDDAELRPIWNYLAPNGYVTGILEVGASEKNTLLSFSKCGEKGLEFLANTYYWLRQEPVKGAETYIYSQPIPMKPNQYFYDRSCQGKNCGSSITDNFQAISKQLDKQSHKSLFIIRDFSYLNALEQKDFPRARGILADIDKAYADALNLTKQSDDYLVILTTGDAKFVDFPDQGKAWYEFDKKGTGVQVKRTKFTNLVLASGARAENFCGIYGDVSVFERILSGPKQQGLEFKIINPFK